MSGEWRNLGLRVYMQSGSFRGHIYVRPRDPPPPHSLAHCQESLNGTNGTEKARWHIESCDSSKINVLGIMLWACGSFYSGFNVWNTTTVGSCQLDFGNTLKAARILSDYFRA